MIEYSEFKWVKFTVDYGFQVVSSFCFDLPQALNRLNMPNEMGAVSGVLLGIRGNKLINTKLHNLLFKAPLDKCLLFPSDNVRQTILNISNAHMINAFWRAAEPGCPRYTTTVGECALYRSIISRLICWAKHYKLHSMYTTLPNCIFNKVLDDWL